MTAIVVSHNSAAVLPRCIDALRNTLSPERILVVDNASSDDSTRVSREMGAEVIASQVNLGYGAACNIGAHATESELLLFANPDVYIASVDSDGLARFLARRPLGLVGPRGLLDEQASQCVPSLRPVRPWPVAIAREALMPIFPRELATRFGTSQGSSFKRSWLSGALLLSARREFVDMGGFDERLFLYYEDQELSMRYARCGLPVAVTDAIVAAHAGGGSSGEERSRRPVPRAASALSSVEFVSIMRGPRAGRRAWLLYRVLSRAAYVFVSLIASGSRSTRIVRKRDELHMTRGAIDALLVSSSSHYPLVRRLSGMLGGSD